MEVTHHKHLISVDKNNSRVTKEDHLKPSNISKFYLVQHQSLKSNYIAKFNVSNIIVWDSRSRVIANPVLDALSFDKDILCSQQVY